MPKPFKSQHMMMMNVSVFLFFAAVAVITAQHPHEQQDDGRHVCYQDASDICGDIPYATYTDVVLCLHEHSSEVSAECMEWLETRLIYRCAPDIQDKCSTMKYHGHWIGQWAVHCLIHSSESLESTCDESLTSIPAYACKASATALCGEELYGQRLVECVHQNIDQVESQCLDALHIAYSKSCENESNDSNENTESNESKETNETSDPTESNETTIETIEIKPKPTDQQSDAYYGVQSIDFGLGNSKESSGVRPETVLALSFVGVAFVGAVGLLIRRRYKHSFERLQEELVV